MTKRIAAKVDEYQKDGETKGKYVDIGVILSNENGEYVMLNPTVDLSGVFMKQRILAQKKGSKVGDNILASIFDNSQQQGQQQQPAHSDAPPADGFDQDIPF